MPLLLALALAAAAPPPTTGPGDVKVNQLIVYGDDPCPKSSEDEIIVCARKPENDRYRIPERLRGNPNDPANDSWSNRAKELQYVGRTGTESCSTVGPGGFTGCLAQIIRQAKAERATSDDVNWNRLIEKAREERLSRIDADAAAAERDSHPPK
jgi:hypothetical protein